MVLNIRAFLFIYFYLFGVQAVPFGPLLVRALGYPPPPPPQKKKKKHEYKLSYMKLSHKACVESELGKTDIYIYIYISTLIQEKCSLTFHLLFYTIFTIIMVML